MAKYNVTNGVTSTGIILNNDSMFVSMGGTADNTTVNADGYLYVLSGGKADHTTVNADAYSLYGRLEVSSGGKADHTTVNEWGELLVLSGGTATNTTVNSNGWLDVWSGGTATGITAVDGAQLDFSVAPGTYVKGTSAGSAFEIKDGVANNFTLKNGDLNLRYGGKADHTTVNEWGHLYVYSGCTATNTTVNENGYLLVSSGGTADKTTLNENGDLYVSSGGKATNTTVNEDGYIFVSNGGTADKTTLNENGDLCVYSGGTATNTTVNDGGELWVKSVGTADKTTVNELGELLVSFGGTATNTTVNSKGCLDVWSGGTATGITAVDGARLYFTVAPGTYVKGTSAGSAFEIKDGVANNFTFKNGHLDLCSGGTADHTTVNEWGHLWVYSGCTATNTTVNENGDVRVCSGGTADKTTVNSKGWLNVSSGGTATNTTVNAYGDIFVYNGGRADNTTVDKKGCLIISSGGTASNATVNSDGHFVVHQGGTATEIAVVDGAYLWFEVVLDTYVKGTSAGSAFEIKNGVANNFTFNHGDLDVSSGGKTTNTTVNSGGALWVSSGGTATKTTVNENGRLYVSFGGLAESTTVKAGGSMWTYDGGTVNSVTVSSGGSFVVKEDGVLTGRMTFEAGAIVSAEDEAVIDFDLTHTSPTSAALLNNLAAVQGTVKYTLTVNGSQNNGAYKLAEGASGFGSKTEITVRNAVGTDIGALTLADKSNSFSYGGKKYTLQLNDESLFVTVVAESGSDNIFTGDVTGTQKDITSGMSALGVNVNALGILNVKPDGNAINTMVNQDGIFMAIKADKVKGLTVNKGGVAYIGSDTVAESFVLNGGEGHIESDGWAFGMSKGKTVGSNTIVKNGGMLFVSAGGHVEGLRASEGGHVIVEGGDINGARFFSATLDAMNGANISAVTLLDGGEMNVFAGGSAQSVHVSEGGILAVESGGELNHINVSSGGILTGVVCSASIVNVYGGTIDFDISGFTPDTAPAYLFEETTLESDEEFPCTLTVGDGQAYGTYGLLDDAYVFKGVITVQNTSGEALGTLAVGSTVNIDGVDYTVNISDYPGYHMTVTIADNEAPTITNIAADITDPTTSNVTVTAEFSDNVALASKQYRIGSGAWTDYATGVTVTENATVTFKAVDTAGNETTDQYAVTNIDREKPEVKNIQLSTIEFTNQDVTVTADFTDNVEVASKQYRIGDGAWTDYTTGVVVTENTTVYFKATDTAGNESDVVPCDVPIIDKVPPTITITPSTTEPGAESVTLSVVCKDETSMSSILQYRIGDGAWQDCIADVVVTENTTVSFKTYDTAGNETIESYVVSNIETIVPDTTKPVVSNVKASTTAATNKNVTVTAEFTDDVAVKSSLYRIGSGAWQDYAGGVTVTENATVSFKAVDTSDNESDVVSIAISNIDKTAPAKPTVTANVTKPTNGSVNVTATFADDSVKNEYSMDGVNWAQYPGVVKFDDNGTVYFRGTDAVGNVSEVASYEVKNIDKVAPAKPTASADITTTTGDNVTVTAVFSSDSAKKEFSLDGLVWQAYTAPLVFSENGRAYFRGTDAAGNVSDIISYEVRNIQPATPDNAPDDGKNDTLYHKKTKEWASEENIASFVVNNITAGDSEVRLDKAGSVDDGKGRHNFVGRAGGDEDAADYAKIQLSKGAALSFSVDSTVAGTFYVYQATTNKKGDLVPAQRQKIAVKAGQTSPKKTATIYLEAGEYFIGMEAKLPAAKKNPEVGAYYSVNLAGTTFFNDADSGWNNSAYQLDDAGKEVKTRLNPELTGTALAFGRGVTSVKLDTGATGRDGYDNWVGFSDAADYRMLTLENDANVTLSLTATGKTKLTIWKVTTNEKKGTISLSSKGSTTAKADKAGTIKAKFLEAGTYFVSVESTDAKKGGGAYYNVTVDTDASVFFDSADDGRNDEMYDKKAKAFYGEDGPHHFETTNVSGAGINVKLDTDPVKADGYKNYVGYGDKTDFAKINLTTDGSLYFKIKTTGEATFTVYRKGQDKKDNDTLETIQTTKLKFDKGASVIDKFTGVISGLAAGEYYISMTATNTSNNAKGSVFYNVTATLEPSDMASLAMPETDTLDMTDALNFASLNTDALADISAASLADLNDKSAWQNLALA